MGSLRAFPCALAQRHARDLRDLREDLHLLLQLASFNKTPDDKSRANQHFISSTLLSDSQSIDPAVDPVLTLEF